MANLSGQNPSTTANPGSGGIQIPHGGAPASGNSTVVQVGEETIQIVPHPTTNRFPWAPVENPTIPIYTTLSTPAVQAQLEPPVIQLAAPVAAAMPRAVSADDTLLAVADELLAAASVTPPAPLPMSVSLPPVVSLPPPPVARPVIQPLAHKQFQPSREDLSSVEQPAHNERVTKHHPVRRTSKRSRTAHIYGFSTREAWRILRPATRIKFLTIIIACIVFVFAMGYWLRSAAPIEVRSIPFVRSMIDGI